MHYTWTRRLFQVPALASPSNKSDRSPPGITISCKKTEIRMQEAVTIFAHEMALWPPPQSCQRHFLATCHARCTAAEAPGPLLCSCTEEGTQRLAAPTEFPKLFHPAGSFSSTAMTALYCSAASSYLPSASYAMPLRWYGHRYLVHR